MRKVGFARSLAALLCGALLLPLAPSSGASTTTLGPCDDSWVAPTPTVVAVTAVPISVVSTTADYFVLYVKHERRSGVWKWIPQSVTRGEAGTTVLSDRLASLAVDRYRVEKYRVDSPADVDGDCVDDMAELADSGRQSPTNPATDAGQLHPGYRSRHLSWHPFHQLPIGAASIDSHEAFEALSYQGSYVLNDPHLTGLEYLKFWILHPGTDSPEVYFINSRATRAHAGYRWLMGWDKNDIHGHLRGEVVYHPNVFAPDGSLGVYRLEFQNYDNVDFWDAAFAYEAVAAAMPVLTNNLKFYPMPVMHKPDGAYTKQKALYDGSRVDVLLDKDILPDIDYVPLNAARGYGLLRVVEPGEVPGARDVVVLRALPNDLPRVAGIITTVPQTPLSHVNLRAIQNGAPNAFVRDVLDDKAVTDLVGSHVYYEVGKDGYVLRAATKAEVDAHHAASRPTKAQTPVRDLTVKKIAALGDVGFDDWDAFGVKAANVAELGRIGGLAEGVAPDGFAVPFWFYDEFMDKAVLSGETVLGKKKDPDAKKVVVAAGSSPAGAVSAMLANKHFQSDFAVQEEMLDDLRKAIKKAASPAWVITALEAMHASFPEGTSLRYRSSTNNEDLPGFNGAGLYDSKTQDPDETAADGIDKSIKAVWASLWNFRAFLERDHHRVDHLATAMGVLVHPNYTGELANGVAVSFDPVTGLDDMYYVNTQLGEDLVTNPNANSLPEQLLLDSAGKATVLARSNLAKPGKLFMSDAQMVELRNSLKAIHDRFKALYQPAAGDKFAMEIEFKITAENKLAIKQARPWVFNDPLDPVCVTDDTDLLAEVEAKAADPWGGTRPDLAEMFSRSYRTMQGKDAYTTADIKTRPDKADPNWQGAGPNPLWQKIYAELDRLQACRAAGTPSTPEISVTAGSGVVEGSSASFTVSASPAPASPLAVSVTVAQAGDWGVSTGSKTVTVPTGGSVAHAVATVDDGVVEADGSVSLTVKTGAGYAVSSTRGSASVAVSDDDDVPEISVTAGPGVVEGGSASFTVSADPVPVAPLAVSVMVAQAGDYAVVGATGSKVVTVPTSGSVTHVVATVDDGADELDGSVSVTMRSGTGYTVSSTQGSASVAVSDDDVPVVSVTAGGGVVEGGNAVFTVSADPVPVSALAVSVTVFARGGFGVAAGARTVTVPTSGAAKLTVATSGDQVDEPDGSVTVRLKTGAGYAVSSTQGSASVVVADDDDPPKKQAPPPVKVCRTADTALLARVAAKAADPWGGARPDLVETFTRSHDTMLGKDSYTVADLKARPDRQTSNWQGAGPNALWQSIYAELDRLQACRAAPTPDTPPQTPEVSVTAGAGVTEGDAAGFTVTASPVPAAPLSVSVTVAQTGDFGVTTGSKTVTIPTAGSAQLSVATVGDNVDEADGSVTVTVGTGSGYTVSGAQGSASVAVSDDDDPPPVVVPEVSVTAGNAITEGGTASFTVTAAPAPSAALSVTVTVGESGDFGVATGSKTVVVPTTGSAQLSVATVGDNVDEVDGSVSVTVAVSTGSGYTVSGTQGAVSVAVVDDDATSVVLEAAVGGSVAEDGGSREITVALGRALVSGESVTVPLAVSGATVGVHYSLGLKQGQGLNEHVALDAADPHSAQNPAVVFAAGARQATLVLTAAPNSDTDERTVRVAYNTGARSPSSQGLSGGITVSGGPVDTSIANDDQPPPVVGASLSVRDAEVSENGRRFLRFMVYLSETPDETVTVQVTTRDGTARNGADYRGYATPSRTLRFAAGTRLLYRYIYIPILDDDTPEQEEAFQAVLTNPTGAPIARGTATITIKDND